MCCSLGGPPEIRIAVNPAKILAQNDKGTLRVSGGRKAYRSWRMPTWLGFRMSFFPAVADYSSSSLLTPAQAHITDGVANLYHPTTDRTLENHHEQLPEPIF
jgi:hypothetical protein